MSFSFYVPAPAPPRFSAFVDALAERDWACPEDAPRDDRFADGFFFHPYLKGRAARGIELGLDRGSFQVRIMTCSSRADYELGVRAADTLARMTQSTVEPEDAGPMPREEAWHEYGDAWIDRMVAWGPDIVARMVDEKKQTLTMSGPRRAFHIGLRFLEELRREANVNESLLTAMVELQRVDEDRYYPAGILRVTSKGAPSGSGFTVAAWAPDVAYLFPDVQYFALDRPSGHLTVPASAGPMVAGSRWRYLDEKNALVEATPAREWEALIARARQYEQAPS